MKILDTNHERLCSIVERDDGPVVLEIVLASPAGGFAMYQMNVPFIAEELARDREEGQSF